MSGPLALGFGLRRGSARDQTALPAGRRQELAGLLLARAVLGRLGGAPQSLQGGFVIKQRLVHRGPQSSSSGVSPPLA